MGMGGTVLAGLTAPRIVDHWGLSAPFWVATGLMVAMAGVFLVLARDAPRPPRTGPAPGMFAALSVFRTSGRAWALTLFYFMAFGGFVAMFLYLPKLLTGVHDLTKADAGARAAGFALLAVIGRPARRLALRPRRRRPRPARLVHRRRRARPRARRRPTRRWSRSRSPA